MAIQVRLGTAALAAGALGLAVAGCGGSSYGGSKSKTKSKTKSTGGGAYGGAGAGGGGASAGGGKKLKLEADEDGGLYFKPKALKAKTGAVTLVMTNPKTTGKMHGIAVKGNGVDQDGPVVKPGGTATVTATLKPGKYTFYCPFDGHAKAGMKGTLTVQ